jgi:hypothetical protein
MPTLIAFGFRTAHPVRIVPAPRWREWMHATNRSANRCLPLLMANQSGWALLNPYPFTATWDGSDHPQGVQFEWDEPSLPEPKPVGSNFGWGVITWTIPFIFRTPRGWNLLARGPANWPRDGISPLEGVVETDWAVSTFTMNWKLTRPGEPVRFEQDAPFCMVVPQRRGELESFSTSVQSLESTPEIYEQSKRWAANRHQAQVNKFLAQYSKDFDPDAWEMDYFKGLLPDGGEAPEHQTKLLLAEFAAPDGGEGDEDSEAH